jgi:predicted DNA-binding transcriptional regulator AlpA
MKANPERPIRPGTVLCIRYIRGVATGRRMLSRERSTTYPQDHDCPVCAELSGDVEGMTTDERLKKLLNASPKQLEAIDEVLERRTIGPLPTTQGPLLMGMAASAEFLGVSRATLWRMIRAGALQKVEVLPGSFRLRRADLQAIAARRTPCRSEACQDSHAASHQPYASPHRRYQPLVEEA